MTNSAADAFGVACAAHHCPVGPERRWMFVPTRARIEPASTRHLRQVAPLWVTTLNEQLHHLAVPFGRDPLGLLSLADQSMPPPSACRRSSAFVFHPFLQGAFRVTPRDD